MYVGGTTLLTGAYSPSEKAKTQGMHDFLVFGVSIISSFSSGLLLKSNGWQMLNYVAIPFLGKRVARPPSLTTLRRVLSRRAAATANRFHCSDRSAVFPTYRATTRQDPGH